MFAGIKKRRIEGDFAEKRNIQLGTDTLRPTPNIKQWTCRLYYVATNLTMQCGHVKYDMFSITPRMGVWVLAQNWTSLRS